MVACTRSCTVSVRKNPPWNCVFVNEDGYPYLVRFGLLLCLSFSLQSRFSLALARNAWWRWRANSDNFLRVHPRRPVVLREALPDFGLDNLLDGVVIAVLGDSYWSRGHVLGVLAREKT